MYILGKLLNMKLPVTRTEEFYDSNRGGNSVMRASAYIYHFQKITISCLRYPWSNLEQVSYDHFTKITISCPNIQISAKNHTLIIFTKLPSAARGTPGAPQNRYYMINFPKITISCPNIQISAKNHTLIIFKNCHQLPEVPLVHPRIGII